jgi:hypothetical protein
MPSLSRARTAGVRVGRLLIVLAVGVLPLATVGATVAATHPAGAVTPGGWTPTGSLPDWAVGGHFVVTGTTNGFVSGNTDRCASVTPGRATPPVSMRCRRTSATA